MPTVLAIFAWKEKLQVLDLQVFYENLQVLYENFQVFYENVQVHYEI